MRVVAHGAVLATIYLLVVTSLAPGDILLAALLGLGVAVAFRGPSARSGASTSAAALAILLLRTTAEVVVGSWRVVRFCLGWRAAPGFVEVPRGDRTEGGVALWGLLTGEAPDEIVVNVDDARDVLVVHLVDASNPDAVRDRHARTYDRWQRRAVP